MKIITVVGARPQFIKAAALSRAIKSHNSSHTLPPVEEILVHTGQHYDKNMSGFFFQELEIQEPHYNLGIGSGSHGQQTGKMLEGIESVLEKEKCDCVVIYGDANSTLAGALAASKLNQPIVHVEAGLRSGNRGMPEEINRIVADHLATLLLCPTQTAVQNLAREGITRGVHLVGDVMRDLLFQILPHTNSSTLEKYNLQPGNYTLMTIHRAENTNDKLALERIINAVTKISESGETIVFPVHPRTKRVLVELNPNLNIQLLEPIGYSEMVCLEKNARIIITDSGGVQKEAYWLNIPCMVLREETEWTETTIGDNNKLVGSDSVRIMKTYEEFSKQHHVKNPQQPHNSQNSAELHLKHILEIRMKT